MFHRNWQIEDLQGLPMACSIVAPSQHLLTPQAGVENTSDNCTWFQQCRKEVKTWQVGQNCGRTGCYPYLNLPVPTTSVPHHVAVSRFEPRKCKRWTVRPDLGFDVAATSSAVQRERYIGRDAREAHTHPPLLSRQESNDEMQLAHSTTG